MPNWCANIVKITGDEKNLERFINDFTRSGEPAMSNILPTPKTLMFRSHPIPKTNIFWGIDKGAEQMDWYSWRLFHWGVKWDIRDVVTLEQDPESMVAYLFVTPWCPPSEFFKYISDMYEVDVALYGYEPGMSFITSDIYGRWGNYCRTFDVDKREELNKANLPKDVMFDLMGETDYEHYFNGKPWPWDEEEDEENE